MAKRRLGPTTNLFPMPVMLVAVRTGDNTANILTVAWGGVVGAPPLLALRIGGNHYSTPYIERERSFTVNIPSADMAMGADYCGIVSGRTDPDKAGTCGWTLVPSVHIASPLIAECPLSFECCLVDAVDKGAGKIYLAEILETHVDESALVDDKTVDAALLNPLVFTPDGYYHRLGERVARAWDIGKALRR